MKQALLPHLCCPICYGALRLDVSECAGEQIVRGVLHCQNCADEYIIDKKIPYLLSKTQTEAYKCYGLGRAWGIMEYANVYFEPLIADGERLPFPANQFDVVFFCGALHHFVNFEVVLQQMHRVLKPRGRLTAAGEPSISIFVTEKHVQDILEEVDEGIIERRPKVLEYVQAIKKAGFSAVAVDTFETYKTSPQQIYQWIAAIRHHLVPVVRTRYKLLVWIVFGLLRLLPYKLAGKIALYINGGNLFLSAKKP